MSRETFKTNYPADAEITLRGDLGNKIGRALNDASGQGRATGVRVIRGPITLTSGEPAPRWTSSDWIVNRSAITLEAFKILQVGDELGHMGVGQNDLENTLDATHKILPFAYEPCLIGNTPQGRVHQIAVLMTPAAIGAAAECQVDGCCTALVNVTSKAHRWAKAIAGSHVLQSAMCGHARIYWKPDATGEQLCRVILGPPQSVLYWGKTTTVLTAATYHSATEVTPGSGTAEIWEKNFSTGKYKAIYANGVSGAALTETIWNFGAEEIDSGNLIGIASDDEFNLCNVVDFCVDGFA